MMEVFFLLSGWWRWGWGRGRGTEQVWKGTEETAWKSEWAKWTRWRWWWRWWRCKCINFWIVAQLPYLVWHILLLWPNILTAYTDTSFINSYRVMMRLAHHLYLLLNWRMGLKMSLLITVHQNQHLMDLPKAHLLHQSLQRRKESLEVMMPNLQMEHLPRRWRQKMYDFRKKENLDAIF